MKVDELRRLLIAPEIIVVDIADAALLALRRALLLEHPALGDADDADDANDDCAVRRRAAVVLRAGARLHDALRAYRNAVDTILDDDASDNLPF